MTERLHGVDTTFLVEIEIVESPGHKLARKHFEELLTSGARLALAPQVLSEFVHVVTDPKRFERPFEMGEALARSRTWWTAKEVVQTFPSPESTDLFLEWMKRHRLGRKRLLDTQLAATYWAAGVREILTSNARDFSVFGVFRTSR